MLFKKDKIITLPVPFLQDKTVLFVDGDAGITHCYIEENEEELAQRFQDAGYSFLFVPSLVESLSQGVLNYLFPGQADIIPARNLYGNIRDFANLGNEAGFLYKRGATVYFHAIPGTSESGIKESVNAFVRSLDHRLETSLGRARFSKAHSRAAFPMEECVAEEAPDYFGLPEPECQIPVLDEEEPLDPRTSAILAAWEKIEREFGITVDDLDIILNYRIKLSRLTVTTSNRIYLSDLPGKPEVKLDDLTKALYFFYLRHPEGSAFKDLLDHEDEIYRIYMGITGRDDIEGIRKTVSALVAPYSDGRNSCVSRIKKAFRDIVGDRIARYYYIDGRYAENRSVRIDRDLVIWEH